jgi:hypothetical protein
MDAAGYVTPEEVRLALRKLHSEDIETNPEKALRQAFADDLKPVDERGRWKPSSLVVLVGAIVFALVGVFVYFSGGMSDGLLL